MSTHLQLMNPVNDELPPPSFSLPLQTHRSSFSCYRHPQDNLTGLCSSCLCERLSIMDQSSFITAESLSNEPPLQLCRTKSSSASRNEETGFLPVGSTNKKEDDVNYYNGGDEVRVSEISDLENDILEMEARIDAIVDNLKSVNDQISLDIHSKKPALSKFWSAASGWSKKFRRKQKKSVTDGNNSRQGHNTQSDYELGRVSFGRKLVGDLEGKIPGGSTQTREYYLNSSSRRRKGLGRSNSMVAANQNAKDIQWRLKFHSIGGEKELSEAGDAIKPRWWR